MLQLIKEPRFDFMGWSRVLVGVSLFLCLASVIILPLRGLKMGIEFTGGTEMQVKYAERPDIGAIRATLERGGVASPIVTTIGDPSENEVYIRLAGVGGSGDVTTEIVRLLRGAAADSERIDLNVADRDTLLGLLRRAPGLGPDEVDRAATAISERRKEVAVFRSMDEIASAASLTGEAREWLNGQTSIGPFALRSQSYIGPAIGKELVGNTIRAVLLSLALMLVYIWFRFQVQWGVAGVLALVHDTLITLGLFSLFDKEMSLPVVAAFLTLIGYSINDTVVVFDRIRENMKNRPGEPLSEVINRSINQTLARTVITSGLTWLSCAALYLFGGPALNAFAFVLTFGIVVGTYSSIFIASPLLVLWSRMVQGKSAASPPAPAKGAGRKVRRPAPSAQA